MAVLDTLEPGSPHYQAWAEQLTPLQVRAHNVAQGPALFLSGSRIICFYWSDFDSRVHCRLLRSSTTLRSECGPCNVHRPLRCGRIGLGMHAHGARNANRRELPRRRGQNPGRIQTFQAKMNVRLCRSFGEDIARLGGASFAPVCTFCHALGWTQLECSAKALLHPKSKSLQHQSSGALFPRRNPATLAFLCRTQLSPISN